MNILYKNTIYIPFCVEEDGEIILKAKSKDGDIININKILEEHTNEQFTNF